MNGTTLQILANLAIHLWIGCILFGLGTIIYFGIKDLIDKNDQKEEE